MSIEEGMRWIKEKKEGMVGEGGFPLLKLLGLWIYSIESFETWYVFSFFFLLFL